MSFAAGSGIERQFLKWSPPTGPDLDREIARLRWAGTRIVVPTVIARGHDAEGSWFVSRALDGDNAVAPRWVLDPRTAVTAIGQGLRALHDVLPVERCPFSWSAQGRVARARLRTEAGLQDPTAWNPAHRDLPIAEALAIVRTPPPVDQLVVCHGDACAPNTLIDDTGRCSGHVDLGSLGVADRWADLAIATWSTQWNYGPGWEDVLLEAYGIDPDPVRTTYYRLLWDLT